MAKGGRRAKKQTRNILKEYQTSRGPQQGFFSTLEKLIEEAPFDRVPPKQWMGYLKPGRVFRREGVEFPLKSEELEYTSLLERLRELEQAGAQGLDRQTVLDMQARQRPVFGLRMAQEPEGIDLQTFPRRLDWKQYGDPEQKAGYRRVTVRPPQYSPSQDRRLSHQSPLSMYQESVTQLQGLDYPSHFDKSTLSWGRTSQHQLPSGERVRLVEEIQSDLHSDARVPIGSGANDNDWEFDSLMRQYLTPEERAEYTERLQRNEPEDWERLHELSQIGQSRMPRRGYRTQEEAQWFEDYLTSDPEEFLRKHNMTEDEARERGERLRYAVPDAPFKDPRSYATLELRKQLWNAAQEGEDYLALARGEDQVKRYDAEDPEIIAGQEYMYDTIYPSVLRSLARQYGADVVEVPVKVSTADDVRPPILWNDHYETIGHFLDDRYLMAMEAPNYTMDHLVRDLKELYNQVYPGLPERVKEDYAPENVVPFIERLGLYKSLDEDQRGAEEWNGIWDTLTQMYDEYENFQQGYARAKVKTFPAIRLTPEVRERIKRAGVPIWTAAGAAVMMDEEEPSLDSLDELRNEAEALGFPKGGRVTTRKRSTPRNVRIKPLKEPKLDKNQFVEDMLFLLQSGTPEARMQYESMANSYAQNLGLKPWEIKKELLELLVMKQRGELPKNPARTFAGWKLFMDPQKMRYRKAKGGVVRALRPDMYRQLASRWEAKYRNYLAEKETLAPEEAARREAEIEALEKLLSAMEDKQTPQLQRGGKVVSGKRQREDREISGIDALRGTAASLAGAIPFLDDEQRKAVEEGINRISHGLASQWHGVDPVSGDVSFFLRTPRLRPTFGGWMDEEGNLLDDEKAAKIRDLEPSILRPAVIDEVVSLPASFFGEMAGFDPEEWPKSQEALERLMQIEDSLRGDFRLSRPEGFGEYALESLGVMAGQIPIPVGTSKFLTTPFRKLGELVKKYAPRGTRRAAQAAAVAPGAVTEFLSPVVEPTMGNYLMGTGAGGALGTLFEKLSPGQEGDFLNELIHAVNSGEISDEDYEALLDLYLNEPDILFGSNEVEETEMAKGGRVRSPANLADIRKLREAQKREIEELNDLWFKLIGDTDVTNFLSMAKRLRRNPEGVELAEYVEKLRDQVLRGELSLDDFPFEELENSIIAYGQKRGFSSRWDDDEDTLTFELPKKAKGGRVPRQRRYVARINDLEGWEREAIGDTPEDSVKNLLEALRESGEFEDEEQLRGVFEEYGVTVNYAPETPIPQELNDILVWLRGARYDPDEIEDMYTRSPELIRKPLDAYAKRKGITFDEAANELANWAELEFPASGIPQPAPTIHAKGGRVRPPRGSLLDLREKLAQLSEIPDASVPTDKALVPVEPPVQAPDVRAPEGGAGFSPEQLQALVEQLESGERSLEDILGGIRMSRRGFLEALASTALPIPDPVTMAAKGLKDAPEAIVTATKAAPVASLSKAAIAEKIQTAWDSLFNSSEDPMFDHAIQALEGIPGAEEFVEGLKQLREIYPEDPDFVFSGIEDGLPQDELAEIARAQGIIKIDPDATDEPTLFVEPQEEGLDKIVTGYLSWLKTRAPEVPHLDETKIESLERWIQSLGNRADFVLNELATTTIDPPEFETLPAFGLEKEDLDILLEVLEDSVSSHAPDISLWARLPIETREKYRELTRKIDSEDLSREEINQAHRERQELLKEMYGDYWTDLDPGVE